MIGEVLLGVGCREFSVNERPARKSMELFDQLYELRGRIEREGERLELVLGDSILKWRLPSVGIHHPILLQRVELHFDPTVPEFTILETDQDVELYSAVLRLAPDLDHQAIAQFRSEIEQGDFHPLNGMVRSRFRVHPELAKLILSQISSDTCSQPERAYSSHRTPQRRCEYFGIRSFTSRLG